MALARATGLDHATLHVHIGMLIWIVGVALAGDMAAIWPLAVATIAELANEGLDRLRTGSWRIADTVQDIVNSLLWPVVLFVLAQVGVI